MPLIVTALVASLVLKLRKKENHLERRKGDKNFKHNNQ